MNNLKFGIEKIIVGSFFTLGLIFLIFGFFKIHPIDIYKFLCSLDGKYLPALSLILIALSYLLGAFGDFFSYLIFRRGPIISYENLILFYQNANKELFNEMDLIPEKWSTQNVSFLAGALHKK